MPMLAIRTNVDVAPDGRGTIVTAASRTVAKALAKPESYVMVSLETGVAMAFAGSTDATAFVELRSFGLTDDRTAELSRLICDVLEERLGVPGGRVYINFADWPRAMWGWDRRTF